LLPARRSIIFEIMPMRSRPGARRPWSHGLVAAILAVLFVGTGAIDAYGLHRCPHHDALPGESADAADAGQPAAEHHHGTPHADAGAAAAGQEQDGHGEHGPCSCIGLCGAASAALPGLSAAEPGPAPVTFAAPAARPASARAIPRADYLLPFANAPPFAR
jgi:hypothetical protein